MSAVNQDQAPLNSVPTGFEVPRQVRIIPDGPAQPMLPIVEKHGSARALVWPGSGAHMRSMHRISLSRGGVTASLQHPMEAVYYVISGGVDVEDLVANTRQPVGPGGMFLIDPGTSYRISAGSDGSELVGGACPADPTLYDGLWSA